MSELILKDIKYEGNSIFITSYPVVGVLGLISFTDIVSGEDENHQFKKYFRYSLNGIDWSESVELTILNLQNIEIKVNQVVKFELQYYKKQPLGDNQLFVEDIKIEYNSTSISIEEVYKDTIFAKFFDSNDPKVLNWYINVLNKLYQKGLLPDYINRKNSENGSNLDFIQFWSTVTKFFAFYVIYSRQFQNFHQSESLLFEFLQQRGLNISNSTTLDQMNRLMQDYYAEIFKRGTLAIVDKEEDGKFVDGELLRLLWYKREKDEFIFNPRLPQHIGWNLGNSSPLYRGLDLHDNANKMPEKGIFPEDITKYTGATLIQDEGHNVISFISLGFIKKIKVSSDLDYCLSFLIKTSGKITITANLYNEENQIISTYSYKDGSIQNKFFEQAQLYRSDKYLPIRLFLYNWNKPLFSQDTTTIRQGNDLKMHQDAVWVSFQIESTETSSLYQLRFLPTSTPYSHGLIQVNNVIDSFLQNNNHYKDFYDITSYIKRYLIPYDSYIFPINIEDFGEIDQESEKPIKETEWIGGDGYCDKASWRPTDPICETIFTKWIPEEETAYCEQVSESRKTKWIGNEETAYCEQIENREFSDEYSSEFN